VNKTQPGTDGLDVFLSGIADIALCQDVAELATMLQRHVGAEPVLWGKALGFGRYAYRYASGRSGEWYVAGIALRKDGPTLHLGCDLDSQSELLARLGKHKAGKGCLYLRRLSDVDREVLDELIRVSVGKLDSQRVDR